MGQIEDAAKEDDNRKLLEQMRLKLARSLDNASPGEAAAVARQLQSVIKDLEAMPAPKEETRVAKLKAQRASRRSSS